MTRKFWLVGLATLAVLLGVWSEPMVSAAPAATSPTQPLFCPFSAHSIAELNQFGSLLGRTPNCALVFNDRAANWAQWVQPWYDVHIDPNLNWAKWRKAAPGRQLVVTQGLIPGNIVSGNWLAIGAAGGYQSYARTFASNLVMAGMGSVYIRLGHEANGTWYWDSVPNNAAGQAKWRIFFAKTVTAMRSVPGAHFKFVWNVNYKVRDLSLDSFYPGNQYVDVIALDAYDSGLRTQTNRFAALWSQPGGISDVLQYAKQHGKPFALPEWGLVPIKESYGGRDDPSYIDGIANLLVTSNVAFSGYWYAHQDMMTLLQTSPYSLARMQYYFSDAARK
jgi:hypothetical protein